MKTSQLIAALAEDQNPPGPPTASALVLAGAAGAGVTALIFAFALGMRDDVAAALATWHLGLKIAVMAAALVAALIMLRRTAQPFSHRGLTWLVAAAPLLVIAGVVHELITLPLQLWPASVIGRNALFCLIAIPFFALVPLGALLVALRSAAPR